MIRRDSEFDFNCWINSSGGNLISAPSCSSTVKPCPRGAAPLHLRPPSERTPTPSQGCHFPSQSLGTLSFRACLSNCLFTGALSDSLPALYLLAASLFNIMSVCCSVPSTVSTTTASPKTEEKKISPPVSKSMIDFAVLGSLYSLLAPLLTVSLPIIGRAPVNGNTFSQKPNIFCHFSLFVL